MLSDVKLTARTFVEILNFDNFLDYKNLLPIISVAGTIFAYFSIIIISLGDFSRYIKNERELKNGNLSLLVNLIIFSIFAVFIVTGSDIFLKQQFNDIEKILINSIEKILSRPRVFIITDENVAGFILPKIKKIFEDGGIETKSIIIQSGEKSKSFESLEKLIRELLSYKIERQDTLIALGGGVIGDLVGFTSSIIYRGINFIQIPTTILSQVDSAVGGKTGINLEEGKNLVGSFHQPKAVITDVSFLKTLPKREIIAGYAEILKYSILGDKDFFNWLKVNQEEILNLNSNLVAEAIEKSCIMKAEIVEKDEKEKGKRALLNLGHTFGHALESKINKDGHLY